MDALGATATCSERLVSLMNSCFLESWTDTSCTCVHTHTHTHTQTKHDTVLGSEKSVLRAWHGFYRLSLKSIYSALCHSMSIYTISCILYNCGCIHSYILHILCNCGGGIHLDYGVNDTPWNYETLSYLQPSCPGKNSL